MTLTVSATTKIECVINFSEVIQDALMDSGNIKKHIGLGLIKHSTYTFYPRLQLQFGYFANGQVIKKIKQK